MGIKSVRKSQGTFGRAAAADDGTRFFSPFERKWPTDAQPQGRQRAGAGARGAVVTNLLCPFEREWPTDAGDGPDSTPE